MEITPYRRFIFGLHVLLILFMVGCGNDSRGGHDRSVVVIIDPCEDGARYDSVLGTCVPTYDDLDGGTHDVLDGSVYDVSDGSLQDTLEDVHTETCFEGLSACGESCVDLQVSFSHCGRCDRPCSAGQLCNNGECIAPPNDCREEGQSCPPAYYCDLINGRCKEGCASNDGCPGANQSCDLGTNACVCDSGFHECGGECVSDNAVATCGTRCSPCPTPDNATPTCDGTSCGFTCNTGFHACSGQCVPDNSVTCGTSCSPCTPPANATSTCHGTTCGYTCDPGYLKCSGSCCRATAVTAGDHHTCALTTAGGLRCWGHNENGQLGHGSGYQGSTLVDVSGLTSGVAAVSLAARHSCALTSAGGVMCWGLNNHGQLGNGTTTSRSTPVNVSGLASGVAAIATGGARSCALTTAGGVKCWGGNVSGELGDGTATNRSTPVDVIGLTSGVAAITAGSRHTCALTTAGGVKCWGVHHGGRLGDGTETSSSTPVDVSGLTSGVVAISAGSDHTCALTTTGGVKCWGSNSDRKLGDGTWTSRPTPVDVSELTSGVAAIAAGFSHTCALTITGGMKCWGANRDGNLGDGTTSTSSPIVDVSGLTSGVAAITAGWGHTCALTTTGGVKCWGDNSYWQLGDGTLTRRTTPVDVSGN